MIRVHKELCMQYNIDKIIVKGDIRDFRGVQEWVEEEADRGQRPEEGAGGETERGTSAQGPGGQEAQVSGQVSGQLTLTVCPERRMTRGGRRDGAPSRTQIMKIMITMIEGAIILLLSQENMKGTLRQGKVKVSCSLYGYEKSK